MRKVITFIACTACAAIPGVASAADGKTVYTENCAACHAEGVANAPRLGSQEDWAPSIAKGRDHLIGYATNGPGHLVWDREVVKLGAMPAKGGTKDLTADEIAAAVDYMIEKGR